MSRVLFGGGGTGGHLYPAMNLAAALREERPGVEVHFVGARRGVEARVLPSRELPHTLLPLEPIRRTRVWRNWRLLPSLTASGWRLRRLFARFEPDLVVGTGGYASGPVCAWAAARGVPVALQEQNSYPGLTTRWMSRWARQVHLGFPEARRYLHPGRETKVFTLGNPIRPPEERLDRAACRRSIGLDPTGVVAIVVGGSQGARAVNEAVLELVERVAAGHLPEPPASFQIFWATGPAHLAGARQRLRSLGRCPWVHTIGYIDDMSRALAAADVAVSRAGAMGTAELLAWGVPSILVPLPTAAANHQEHNARSLAEAGAAMHLPESELDADRLWAALLDLARDPDRRRRMADAAKRRAQPNAVRATVKQLVTLLED